mmetsp:Transcript_27935/g.50920  ORF Transcript_27935/g.50920 Transcript_27935/m.50920 type:complete len:83 (-) Transcript_27935:97-345(-)
MHNLLSLALDFFGSVKDVTSQLMKYYLFPNKRRYLKILKGDKELSNRVFCTIFHIKQPISYIASFSLRRRENRICSPLLFLY